MKLTTTIALLFLLLTIGCKKDAPPKPQPQPQPPALSSNKDITDFTFTSADNSNYLPYGYRGYINNDTIQFIFPVGTQVSIWCQQLQ